MARKLVTVLTLLSLVMVGAGCSAGTSSANKWKEFQGGLANAFGNALNGALTSGSTLKVAVADPAELHVRLDAAEAGEAPRVLLRIDSPDGVPAAEITIRLEFEPALGRRLQTVRLFREGRENPSFRARVAPREMRITVLNPVADIVELGFGRVPQGAHALAIRSVRAEGANGDPVPIVMESESALLLAR